MLESVIRKFKDSGCSLLDHVDVTSSQEWLMDLFFVPSDERKRLIDWWIRSLDPSLATVDAADFIKSLGICSSLESSSFVSGVLSKSKLLNVWEHLAGLKSDSEINLETELEDQKRVKGFIESVSETIDYNVLLKSKIDIVPFHFEKEIKNRLGTPSKAGIPSLEDLKGTLFKGKQLHSSLGHFADLNSDNSDDNVIEDIRKLSEDISEKLDQFHVTNNTEFSPWLARPEMFTRYKKREEIPEAKEAIERLSTHFQKKAAIANNIKQVLDIGNKDIKKLTSDVARADFDELNVINNIFNLARAPAAS